MHTSKDSMWREIWKILQNFCGTKHGLYTEIWFGRRQTTTTYCLGIYKLGRIWTFGDFVEKKNVLTPIHFKIYFPKSPRQEHCCGYINRQETTYKHKRKNWQPHKGGDNKTTTTTNTTVAQPSKQCPPNATLHGTGNKFCNSGRRRIWLRSESSRDRNNIKQCHKCRTKNQSFSTKAPKREGPHDRASKRVECRRHCRP